MTTSPDSSLTDIYALLAAQEREYDAAIEKLHDKNGRYIVVLASMGNPDFRQHAGRSLPGVPRRKLRVATLRAARDACRLYIEHHELGGGNWAGGEVRCRPAPERKGAPRAGDVVDRAGAIVAQISYNGRVWMPGRYPQPEITDLDGNASEVAS